MRWLTGKKDEGSRAPQPHVAIESLERARPEGREGRLFDLVILSLYLHSAGSSHEMMTAFLERAPEVTQSVFVYPLVLDKKRDMLTAAPLEGTVEARLEQAMDAFQEDLTAVHMDLPVSHFRRLVIEGGEVVIRDSMVDFWRGVFDPEVVRTAEEKLGIRQVAMVPMLVEGEPYGVVLFGFDRTQLDAEIVELLVGHFTLALRGIAQQEDTARFNDVDPVTWVYNRRFISEMVEQEIIRCARYGKTLSLVILDLDDFGAFNAAYGQSLGDRLLRSAAVSLAEATSPPEVVARLIDDEFAVLLQETNRAGAVAAASRMMANMAQVSTFGADGSPEPLKASVAIVCYPEDGTSAKELMASAEAELAQAKREQEERARAGPNRSVNPLARAAGERR